MSGTKAGWSRAAGRSSRWLKYFFYSLPAQTQSEILSWAGLLGTRTRLSVETSGRGSTFHPEYQTSMSRVSIPPPHEKAVPPPEYLFMRCQSILESQGCSRKYTLFPHLTAAARAIARNRFFRHITSRRVFFFFSRGSLISMGKEKKIPDRSGVEYSSCRSVRSRNQTCHFA